MRISDWSSDVFSSDLVALARFQTALMQEVITPDFQLPCRLDLARLTTEATVSQETGGLNPKRPLTASDRSPLRRWIAPARSVYAACDEIGRASCRARVCQYV